MITVRNQKVKLNLPNDISVFMKREDRIHPFVSGNKYRKLKYNLEKAQSQGYKTLLTFGGAYSNHIAATAVAAQQQGFRAIGVIRGEELHNLIDENPTLRFAQSCGMKFKFISREAYRVKNAPAFVNDLRSEFGDFFLIPEGGTNTLAVRGCEEILTSGDAMFDYICCPVGTGGTISGLINCSKLGQQVLGFPALKGDFLREEIRKFANNDRWKLITDYHFGGYAKINEDLVRFLNDFKRQTQIPLDPVYTGKMMYGILDLVKKGYFKEGTQILAIHTGGLQGIAGMNERLKKKNIPLIEL